MKTKFQTDLGFPASLAAWGQDTRVRDAEGPPRAVFAAALSPLPTFPVKTTFGTYASAKMSLFDLSVQSPETDTGAIYKAYLNITNPYRVLDCWHGDAIGLGGDKLFTLTRDFSPQEIYHILLPIDDGGDLEFKMNTADVMAQWQTLGKSPPPTPAGHDPQWDARVYLATERFLQAVTDKGYDGLVYINDFDPGLGDSWVIFKDEQCVLAPKRLTVDLPQSATVHNPQEPLPAGLQHYTTLRR